MSGHSDFGNFNDVGLTWVWAGIAMITITFAAVICDADEPCSVKTV